MVLGSVVASESISRGDLEKAIGPKTAAVHYYAVAQEPDPLALTLEDTVEIAHARAVPVLVGAAGQILSPRPIRQLRTPGGRFSVHSRQIPGLHSVRWPGLRQSGHDQKTGSPVLRQL